MNAIIIYILELILMLVYDIIKVKFTNTNKKKQKWSISNKSTFNNK